MNMIGIVGIALITAIFAVMLKRHHGEYAIIISICGGAVVIFLILTQITPALNQVNEWISAVGIPNQAALILLKTLGICFLTQFAVDSCKDAGESALASKVELARKVTVVVMALPLFQSIASTAVSLVGGG